MKYMEDVRIILSGLWVATMLVYLLGDVLRIFSGDIVAGEMQGMKVTQTMWLGIAALMVILFYKGIDFRKKRINSGT